MLPTGPWSPLGPGGPGNGLFLSGLPASPERKKTCPYESFSHGKVLLLCLLDIFSLRDDGEVQGSARKWFSRAVGDFFPTFLECSQMSGVFYYSVIHGLGFIICFMI